MQSGSDSVLKRMNRHYTTDEFLKGVQLIRSYFPDAAFTTDVIVGFCGETEDEFLETCRFVEKVGFSDIHVFPYSPRVGTVAYRIMTDVDGETKNRRAHELGKIKESLKNKFLNQQMGKTKDVLAERCRNGLWEGYSSDYTRVYFKGNVSEGQIVNVVATEIFKDGVKGEIV